MEITESSIHEVKAYDAKVSEVLSGLKPAVTVELIRRGENPLNLTMNELKNSLDSIQEEIGAGAEEKYSTYLWKLEKLSGGLTEEERSSYIGIYRLLNNIEKTDGAAIGAVLNTGAELTLSNLLSAVRTLKNKGIDKKVDDSFGGLTDLTFSTERISDQIERAFNQGSALAEARLNARTERSERTERGVQTEYLGSLVNRTLDNLSPEQVIKTVEESEGDVMAFSLESFCERLQEQKEDATLSKSYYKEQLKEVQRLAEDKEAVAFLETYGGEATIRNLQAADTWFTGNKNLYKEIGKKADNISKETGDGYKESIKEVLEGMDSQESLLESQKKVNASMEGIIKEAFSEPALTANEAENLRLMQKGIALARTLSRQEHYEMPVVIGDEVSSLSLTILKGTQTSGKAEIRIDFPKQGVVEAELTVKNDEIKGFILCKTKDGQELVEDCLDGLKEGLEGLGLTVKQMNVGTSNKGMATGSKATKSENDQTDTKVLYQAAKLLVKQTIERAQVIENGS
jgi:flagellar hook-length control protein FliK